MNEETTAKIKMLKGSLHCFVYGLFALLPVIGLPFAIGALWTAGSVRRAEKRFWNAAKPYRLWGMTCAIIGALLGTGIFITYAIIAYNAIYGED